MAEEEAGEDGGDDLLGMEPRLGPNEDLYIKVTTSGMGYALAYFAS